MKKLNEFQLISIKGGVGCQKYIRRYVRATSMSMSAEQKDDLLFALLEAYEDCIQAKYE